MSRTDWPGSSVLGLAEGQRPGDRGGRGDLARRHPDLLPPADEVVPVVPAGQRRVGDHRGGLGQGQRLTAERLDEVDGAVALSGVDAEPLGQAAEGLADAEEADREDPRPVPAGRDGRLRAGDQEPARRAFGPEPVKLVHVGQVVEHDQPRLTGFGEPADEAGRDRFGRAGRLDAGGRHPRLDVPREHRRPAGGGDPDHHVDGAGSPQRFREHHRDLGLARRAQPVLLALGEFRAGHERDGRPRDQSVQDAPGGIGPVAKSLGQRRHVAHPEPY